MNTGVKSARYLVGGLVMGGLWYLNHSRPAWEEALRTVVVFSVIMVVLHVRLRRRHVVVHLVPLIASRVVLVAIAAGVEQVMRHHGVDNAALIVAIGLGVVDCVIGVLAHNRFFTYVGSAPAPTPTTGHAR